MRLVTARSLLADEVDEYPPRGEGCNVHADLKPTRISVELDSRLFETQMACLRELLTQLPPKRRRKFFHKFLRLSLASGQCCVLDATYPSALGAVQARLRCRIRVRGLDELIAAVMRAARGKGFLFHGAGASDEC